MKENSFAKTVFCAIAVVATTISLATPASALSETELQSVVDSGNGTVVLEQFPITPGELVTVGRSYSDRLTRATWGTSYAISTEVAFLWYKAKAKAAANVYSNLRIIKVCFYYTRNNVVISSTKCSTANSNGSYWTAGPEVTDTVTDSIISGATNTSIFNIVTTRINPNIR